MKRSWWMVCGLMVAGFLAAQPAAAQGIEAVGQGDLAYRWRRGSLTLELRNRGKNWTAGEAGWMGELLSTLPTVYLRKAIEGGMRKVYRDRTPHAPWNTLVGPRDVSGVAVPPAPWRFVALGDRAFNRGRDTFDRVMVHEIGHCVQWRLSGWGTVAGGTSGFTNISWTTGVPGVGLKSWNGFPSNYARNSHMEDFAEACEYYWFSPDALREASVAKYRFVRDVVFEGVRSPNSVRQDRDAIDPVRPRISSLSDRDDDWYSRIKVRGEHFMGPLDGGYNRVYFRGKRALHLPVSRTRITTWVPRVTPGSTQVKVRTQDGLSGGSSFRVRKRPWWKFW